MRSTLLAMTVAMSVLPAAAFSTPSAPMGGWALSGTMSTQRSGVMSVLLTDGRVLVTGTSADDYSGLGNVDVYDPSRGWSAGPRLTGDPLGAAIAPLPNGGALLAGGTPYLGGFDGPGPPPTATALTYDPASGAWQAAPNMGAPRYAATATPLADGRVLVAGGYDRTVKQLPNPGGQPFCCLQIDFIPLSSAEIFDPRTRGWSPAGKLAEPRFRQDSVALKDGRVLVVGGDQNPSSTTHLASAEVFDPVTGRWSSAGTIGDSRTHFSLTALPDGRALLVAGLASDGVTVLRSTLLYDPRKNSWSAGPDLQVARTDQAAAALKDGRVLVAGGVDRLGRLAASEIVDAAASTSVEAGALATARSDAASVALEDGRILVAGGIGSRGALQDSEIFDPRMPGNQPAPRTVGGPGHWVARHPQPGPSYAQTLSLRRDGRVLVLPEGGYPDFAAQVYDPTADAWTTVIERPGGQTFTSAVALADGRILLVTLASDGQSPGRAETVDLTTGISTPAASPGSLGAARLDLLPDGRVWLTGGMVGDKHSSFYDPAANKWSSGPDVPSDLWVGTVSMLPDGSILVGGITQAMVLDPRSGAWRPVATYPVHWNDYSATPLAGGDVLFAGGLEDVTQPDGRQVPIATRRVMRYDHITGALRPVASMPSTRAFSSTAVLRDGRVLFAGGVFGDTQTDPVASAELYDPVKNTWSPAMSMPEARSQASAVLLRDGSVLELGGYGLLNPPHTLIYTPESSVRSTPVGSVSGQQQQVALLFGLAILGLSALISSLLILAARRRVSARRGP